MIKIKKLNLCIFAGLLGVSNISYSQTIQELLNQRNMERMSQQNQSNNNSQRNNNQNTAQNENQSQINPSVYGDELGTFVRDNGLPPLIEDNPYSNALKSEAANNYVRPETMMVTHSGLSVPIEMTIGELEFLHARQESINKYLYENMMMEDSRELLREYYRQQEANRLIREKMPFSPTEILQFRVAQEQENAALNSRLAPLNHHIRSVEVDLEGTQPMHVFVAKGMVSSLVFFDSTGAPWPVEGEVIGDSTAYESKVTTESMNVVTFFIKRDFTETNALITLKGISTPIVVKLVSNNKDNDDRLSARIPFPGPNANVRLFMEDEFENHSTDLTSILNNSSLEGAKKYGLSGVRGEVFIKNGMMYVKTFADLLRPGWHREATSTTGFKVYEMKPTEKLMFMVNGNIIQAKVEGLNFFDINYASSELN